MNCIKKWGLFLSLFFFLLSCEPNITYDLVIINGDVFEGSQKAPIISKEIGIIGGKMVTMGKIRNPKAKRIIDVKGLVVSTGFTDLHAH